MTLELKKSDVHVWRAPLEVSGDVLRACKTWLSDDERDRASHFRIERLRRQFVVRRGLLRDLLGRYLDAHPGDLRFDYGAQDKPRLRGEPAWENLAFNCSHSHGVALFAVTKGRSIGVDLEKIRADISFGEIAARYFAPSEAARLASEPDAGQPALFFRYWTCKEAWIKAKGGGLSIPLEQFEILFQSGDARARVSIRDDSPAESQWYVHPLEVQTGYAAALAVAEPGLEIQIREWNPEKTAFLFE